MKRWMGFDAHLDTDFSGASTSNTVFEVVRFGRVFVRFSTLEDAQAWIASQNVFVRDQYSIRENQTVSREPVFTGQALATITPLPLFREPGTVLRTRGFWDTTLSIGSGPATVATFSFGMFFMPMKSVYELGHDDNGVPSYSFHNDATVPDILLDDVGWFVYESFARIVGGSVQHDPPFDSKSKRNFKAHSALIVACGFTVKTPTVTKVDLTFGARFRMLVDDP